MTETTYYLRLLCGRGDITYTPIARPDIAPDGTVSGYAGSDRDYCSVCDTDIMYPLEVVTELPTEPEPNSYMHRLARRMDLAENRRRR